MEMDTEPERKSGRKGGDDGKMVATGKGSASGAMTRRRSRRKGGRGVLGKRQGTSKPQDEEEADPKEEKQESSSSSLLSLGKEGLKVEKNNTDHIVEDEDFMEIVGMNAEEWAEHKANAVPILKSEETIEEWKARKEEEEKVDREEIGSDYEAWQASQLRRYWNHVWSGSNGSFEDTTRILPMRFTHKPVLDCSTDATPTLQIFSVKIVATRGGLQWPLDVFGIVAMRDHFDRNRNIVFHRTRDNCQILTDEDRNLVLVGPTRAVALSMPEPVTIEVELKVKGTTESDDKDLSFLAVPFLCSNAYYSRVLNSGSYSSKLSTLEFRLGYIVSSVEATISVRVIRGSWPDGFCGQFDAFTTGVHCKNMAHEDTSTDHEKITLLDSRGEKVVTADCSKIKLSRCVVSVESRGELKVSVKAWKLDNSVTETAMVFTALEAGLSKDELEIGFCKLEINVAWSLISQHPVFANTVLYLLVPKSYIMGTFGCLAHIWPTTDRLSASSFCI